NSDHNAVSGATISLFDGATLVVASTSASNGKFEYAASSGKSYDVVIAHSNYVTKVVSGITPVGENENNFTEIVLERTTIDPPNYGTVKVHVVDEEGASVSSAKVYLFQEGFAGYIGYALSTSDGNASFSNLAPGSYYAFASKSDSEGTSSKISLSAGQTVSLSVKIILGKGKLQVSTHDRDDAAIASAGVKVYDYASSNALLSDTQTGTDGKTSEMQFSLAVVPYAVASKSGYYSSTSPAVSLFKNSVSKIDLTMLPSNSISKLNVELLDLRSASDISQPATRFSAGTSYWMHFLLEVPNAQENVEVAVRTDLDSLKSRDNIRFYIEDATARASWTKSASYDSSNPYSDANATNGNAKQVHFKFGNLNAGVYEFFVKATTVESLASGTSLEVHYRAKSSLQSTDDLKTVYTIGSSVCRNNCPNFFFDVLLENSENSGETFHKNSDSSRSEIELLSNASYDVEYEVINSGNNNFSGVSASYSDSATSLSYSSTSASLGNLSKGESAQSSFSFSTPLQVSGSALKLLLSSTPSVSDNNFDIPFKVETGNELEFDLSPLSLVAGIPGQQLIVHAFDPSSGVDLKNAWIKAKFDSLDFSSPDFTASTDENGLAILNLSELSDGTLNVLVKRYGYMDKNKSVLVSGAIYTSSEDRFKCVSFSSPSTGQQMDSFSVNRGEAVTVQISSTDCIEPLSIQSVTLSSVSNLAINYSSISLNKTDSNAISVSSNSTTALGIHPIYFQGKFSSDSAYTLFAGVEVHVSDSTSPFSLSKYAFDVNHQTDSGTFVNSIPLYVQDISLPSLKFSDSDSALVEAQYDKPEVPEKLDENVYVTATGMYNCNGSTYETAECAKGPYSVQASPPSANQEFGPWPFSCDFGRQVSNVSVAASDTSTLVRSSIDDESLNIQNEASACTANPTPLFTYAGAIISGYDRIIYLPDYLSDSQRYVQNVVIDEIHATVLSVGQTMPTHLSLYVQYEGGSFTYIGGASPFTCSQYSNDPSMPPNTCYIAVADSFSVNLTSSTKVLQFKLTADGEPTSTSYRLKLYPAQATASPLAEKPKISLAEKNQTIASFDAANTTVSGNAYAKFVGEDFDTGGSVDFNIVNYGLNGLNFKLLTAKDYVQTLGGGNQDVSFSYTVSSSGTNGTFQSFSKTIPSDGKEHDLDGFSLSGSMPYYIINSDPNVSVYFEDTGSAISYSSAARVFAKSATTSWNLACGSEGTSQNWIGNFQTREDVAKSIIAYHPADDTIHTFTCANGDTTCVYNMECRYTKRYEITDSKLSAYDYDYYLTDSSTTVKSEATYWASVIVQAFDSAGNYLLPQNNNYERVCDMGVGVNKIDSWQSVTVDIKDKLRDCFNFSQSSKVWGCPAQMDSTGNFLGYSCNGVTGDRNASSSDINYVLVIWRAAVSPKAYNSNHSNVFDSNVEIYFDGGLKDVLEGSMQQTREEKFLVKLNAAEAQTCYSSSGEMGSTGSGALPRVKLAWGWSDINAETCDSAYSNSVYCDSTQFTLSLFKRLQKLEQYYRDSNFEEINKISSFKALL
ncbi:MAG: carboxypeptidase-like regulatory domain-containing protein, partial [Candidatus Diapherotrites archaeon]